MAKFNYKGYQTNIRPIQGTALYGSSKPSTSYRLEDFKNESTKDKFWVGGTYGSLTNAKQGARINIDNRLDELLK